MALTKAEHKEILGLLEEVRDLFTDQSAGVVDYQKAMASVRAAAKLGMPAPPVEPGQPSPLAFPHDDDAHEGADTTDHMQRYCPSCFVIHVTRRIEVLLK